MAQHLSVRVTWKDNGWTGLVYRDAIEQYKACRSSRELLLSGKERAIVHFAVDTEEVWMATQLNGADTVFIPFNKGCNGGAGNPAVEGDYRTSYLWKEVLRRDSILDILQRFVQTMKVKNGKRGETRLVFPRFHQLDAVRRIVEDVRKNLGGAQLFGATFRRFGQVEYNSVACLSSSQFVRRG